ncbi:hypothetical protein J5751_06765 [bacterium]|nr:hypothetical protein [bacterium]
MTEAFSIANHKCVRFFGNNFVINNTKYFKNGNINKTVMNLNETAKIDNHKTLSTHILINVQSYKRYVKNQKMVANKLKNT